MQDFRIVSRSSCDRAEDIGHFGDSLKHANILIADAVLLADIQD